MRARGWRALLGSWHSLAILACAAVLPILIMASCVSWQKALPAERDRNGCLDLTPENTLSPVRACETATHYVFESEGRSHSYDKAWYRKLLGERLMQFLRQTAYPWQSLRHATVEVWLTAPVFHPEKAHLIAAVASSAGNFALPLSIEPDSWSFTDDGLLLLGRARYPAARALRSGSLKVQARGHISPEEFSRFLNATLGPARHLLAANAPSELGPRPGAREPTDDWPVTVLATRAFAERALATRISRAARAAYYIENLDLLPALEADGARKRFISFSFP